MTETAHEHGEFRVDATTEPTVFRIVCGTCGAVTDLLRQYASIEAADRPSAGTATYELVKRARELKWT